MATGTDVVEGIRRTWARLGGSRPGRWLFGRLLGRAIRYTGSIRPEIVELAPGRAVVRMRDRPAVRNHLRSIHAVALVNLAEITSGLAFNVGLPRDARGIVTGLSIEYLKKGRGTLTAVCDCPVPPDNAEREWPVTAAITDEQGDVVARLTARWLVRPVV